MKRILNSFLIVVLLISNFNFMAFSETYDYQVDVAVDRNFSVLGEEGTHQAVINNLDSTKNTVDITYTITFGPIEKQEIKVPVPPKEVVLVLDRSGSMRWDLAGNEPKSSRFDGTSRMSILKNAASSFVDKLSENPNLKLSLITYSSSSKMFTRNSTNLIDISNGTVQGTTQYYNKEEIKLEINNMRPDGGTNVGDSMRKSYQLAGSTQSNDAAEKFFVFLSDGEPSFYSYKDYTSNRPDSSYLVSGYSNRYYYDGTATSPSTNGSNDYARGIKYAELMASKLDVFDKSYFLAFNTSPQNELENIAQNVNNQDYQQAETADEINGVYGEISKEILADLRIDNVSCSDVLPEGLTIDTTDTNFDSDKFTIDGQNFTYDMDSISYKLNDSRTAYIAEPVTFTIKANYSSAGIYTFGEGGSELSYKDIDGVDKIKHAAVDIFTVERNPVKNVTATRPQEAGENPDNNVIVSWDPYAGAKTYKIYKVVDEVDVEIGTVGSNQTSFVTPITADDGATTVYKVEAVLTNDKLSGKGEGIGNTVPSILNLTVERENNTYIVSWDQIADETNVKYNLTPYIEKNGKDKDLIRVDDKINPTDDDVFTILNRRVSYRYDLVDPEQYTSYDDEIKFIVDAFKKDKISDADIDVNESTSEPLKIKQVVKTEIETDLGDFYYAKSKTVKVKILSDSPFPTGVDLFDPMVVVELLLLEENEETPLEFTYPTMKLYDVEGSNAETAVGTTVTSLTEGDVKLYIQLDDYSNTVFTPGTDLNLYLNYSIAYESSDSKLDEGVYDALKDKVINGVKVNGDLQAYQIENEIIKLLNQFYTSDINYMIVMKTCFMYNTTAKHIDDPTMRDEKVGKSTKFIRLKDVEEIKDEF